METDKKRASTNGRFRHTPFGRTLVSNLFGRQQGTKMSASKLTGRPLKTNAQRLKLLMFGPPGCGKTTAAIQMPRPYILDMERGCVHYKGLIDKAGGVVVPAEDENDPSSKPSKPPPSYNEVVSEIHALMTEDHPYQTLVIDPVTPLYDQLLTDAEKKVGRDWGVHYQDAAKKMKRLMNLILGLDMNVIMTAHSKNEYGDALKVIGQTFDGWKNLPYIFDLVLRLRQVSPQVREAEVIKTRISQFPSGDQFAWSYEAIADRYGVDVLERKSAKLDLATDEHVIQFNDLFAKLEETEIERLGIKKALRGVADIADLEDARIVKGISVLEEYLSTKKGSM